MSVRRKEGREGDSPRRSVFKAPCTRARMPGVGGCSVATMQRFSSCRACAWGMRHGRRPMQKCASARDERPQRLAADADAKHAAIRYAQTRRRSRALRYQHRLAAPPRAPRLLDPGPGLLRTNRAFPDMRTISSRQRTCRRRRSASLSGVWYGQRNKPRMHCSMPDTAAMCPAEDPIHKESKRLR